MDKVINKLRIVKCPKLKDFFKKVFLKVVMPFANIIGPEKKI